MSKKMKRAVVGVFGVLCVLVLIFTFVLGVNLIKNRWHKLNFIIDTVTVTRIPETETRTKYHVELDGSVRTWFYDFNTYEFDMALSSGGISTPFNVKCGDTIVADHKGSNELKITFDTYNLEDMKNYTFRGKNVYISGNPKEATDIKLFLSEHLDKMVFTD